MWILERSEYFEVIPIETIVHNVHLIPFFDATTSAKDTLKAKKDAYSFQRYLLNHYSDNYSFFKFF